MIIWHRCWRVCFTCSTSDWLPSMCILFILLLLLLISLLLLLFVSLSIHSPASCQRCSSSLLHFNCQFQVCDMSNQILQNCV